MYAIFLWTTVHKETTHGNLTGLDRIVLSDDGESNSSLTQVIQYVTNSAQEMTWTLKSTWSGTSAVLDEQAHMHEGDGIESRSCHEASNMWFNFIWQLASTLILNPAWRSTDGDTGILVLKVIKRNADVVTFWLLECSGESPLWTPKTAHLNFSFGETPVNRGSGHNHSQVRVSQDIGPAFPNWAVLNAASTWCVSCHVKHTPSMKVVVQGMFFWAKLECGEPLLAPLQNDFWAFTLFDVLDYDSQSAWSAGGLHTRMPCLNKSGIFCLMWHHWQQAGASMNAPPPGRIALLALPKGLGAHNTTCNTILKGLQFRLVCFSRLLPLVLCFCREVLQ